MFARLVAVLDGLETGRLTAAQASAIASLVRAMVTVAEHGELELCAAAKWSQSPLDVRVGPLEPAILDGRTSGQRQMPRSLAFHLHDVIVKIARYVRGRT